MFERLAPLLRFDLVGWTLVAATAAAVFLAGQVYTYSSVSDPAPADAAVVLGAAVYRSRPSPVLQERIKHAVDLLQSGQVRYVLFTGGRAQGDRVAESEAGREYALRKGVPEDRILYESVSRVTFENLREARAILASRHLGRVLIVSDPIHMRRAMSIARDLGLDAHPSPTPTTRYRTWTWRSKFGFLMRETYNYAVYLTKRPFLGVRTG